MAKDVSDKYQDILEASIELMKEKGFEKTSVSEIVKKAGVAQGTFYLYFESKLAVVPAIARRILEELLGEIKKADMESENIHDTFRVIVDVTFDITKKHKDLIIFCYAGIAFNNSFKLWEDIYSTYYTWLGTKLQKAIANNEISYPHNSYNLAKMIIGLVENTAEVFYFSHMYNEKDTHEDKERVLYMIKKALL